MKQIVAILSLFLISKFSFSQNMTDFFVNHRGIQNLGSCVHLTNTFYYDYYDVKPDHVMVEIHYKDLNLNNDSVVTRVSLHIGTGLLPFDRITANYDNDWVNPFAALGVSCWFVKQAIRNSNPDDYQKTRSAMNVLLGTDPDDWNGADWALFVMNLIYINYCTSK